MAPGAGVARDYDLGLGGVGQHAARGLPGPFATERHGWLVLHLLLDAGEELTVVLVGALTAGLEDLEGFALRRDLGRQHESDLGFIDVSLAELGVREMTVAHQLVCECAADALEEE